MRGVYERVSRMSFARFLVSGGFNTLFTYLVYLAALNVVSYRVSYSIAYASGILLAYVLNRIYVFKSHRGARSFLLLPLVYAVQYGLSMLILHVWVEMLGFSEKPAPLVAIALTVPVTYLLSKRIFRAE